MSLRASTCVDFYGRWQTSRRFASERRPYVDGDRCDVIRSRRRWWGGWRWWRARRRRSWKENLEIFMSFVRVFSLLITLFVVWRKSFRLSPSCQTLIFTHQTNAVSSTSVWYAEKLSSLALEMFLISTKALSFNSANDSDDDVVVVPLRATLSSVDTGGSWNWISNCARNTGMIDLSKANVSTSMPSTTQLRQNVRKRAFLNLGLRFDLLALPSSSSQLLKRKTREAKEKLLRIIRQKPHIYCEWCDKFSIYLFRQRFPHSHLHLML